MDIKACRSAFDTNKCDVQAYIQSSLTNKQIQTQEMFIWVLTFTVFFAVMFLSFMVTHLKNARIKKAKENLAFLDVNPGITIYKNPDGAKLVQKKKKNPPGGAATVVIIFGILVLVSYVLATEFDQPGELGFQRKLYKGFDGKITFRSTAFEIDSKQLNPQTQHNLDLGLVINREEAPTGLYFVASNSDPCVPEVRNCMPSQDPYITTSYDFWNTPTTVDVTLCGDLPPNRVNNTFSFLMYSKAVGNGGFRASAVVFDEPLTRWETTSALDVFPRFEVSVTAVTAYRLSVFLAEYIVPPPNLHKVRVDSIVTKEGITTNACPNPIAQFTITGNLWEINGVYIAGLSTVVISAIGAAGTLFSIRTTIKSVFEYIHNAYNSSIRKRRALVITGYSIQTLFGAFAPLAVLFGITFLVKFAQLTEQMIYSLFAGFVFAFVIWIYWIFSTVVFARNIRELNKETKAHNKGIDIINDSGSNEETTNYVKLESE